MAENPDFDRFADGLIALAEAAGAAERVERDMLRLSDSVAQHEPLKRFLTDPAVRAEGKERALADLLGGSLHPVCFRFLFMLLDLDRIRDLSAVIESFVRRVRLGSRQEAGEIVAAVPPSEAHVQAVSREVERILGYPVHLRVRLDPAVLGGLRVRVGDFVFDGTLSRSIERFHRLLVA